MENERINMQNLLEEIRGEKWEKFLAFAAYLKEFNAKYNLTAITEEKDVLYKHFLDSVSGKAFFKTGACVAEVGSGAGFPSVPLKILREDLSFTLMESVGKKCDFLNYVVDKLDFYGMNICNIRAEDAARSEKHREKYDHATARAVAAMNTLCEYTLPLVKVGGTFVAYKSADEKELLEAKKACVVLGGKEIVRYPYALPEGYGERCIAVAEKVKKTPEKYPRGNGKERKQPL